MVRTYKLRASVTATGSALAQVDIRRNGRILGAQISILPTVNAAAGDYVEAELSLYPSTQITTNDAMGVIAHASGGAQFLTSGSVPATNVYKPSFGIEVRVGDRLYLHALEAGTQTYFVNVLVDVDEV